MDKGRKCGEGARWLDVTFLVLGGVVGSAEHCPSSFRTGTTTSKLLQAAPDGRTLIVSSRGQHALTITGPGLAHAPHQG